MRRASPIFAVFCLFLAGLISACRSTTDNASDAGGRDASMNDAFMQDAGVDSSVDAASDAGLDASVGSRIDELVHALTTNNSIEEVNALLHEVSFNEGWPLHEGTRYLFATQWNDAPSNVSFVSDVNAWSTSAHAATRALSLVHYFVVIDEGDFAVPASGAKFKWWGSPDVYRAPLEATGYGYDEFGEFGWVAPPSDQAYLERFPDMSSAHLARARTVRVWLPAGFVAGSSAASHMRTLVLHDGQNVFDPNAFNGGWQADVALAAGYTDVVAIAIDNAPDRFAVYTHVPDRIDATTVGGDADDYLDMIDTEVLPFARARYGIAANGDSVMIAGSSLGGLVSIYAAMSRPTLYACAAGFSSTLGWGSLAGDVSDNTVIERWPSHLSSSIYIDSGGDMGGGCLDDDGDGVDDDGSDGDNYCVTVQMRERLLELGYVSGTDLFYVFDPGAGHNEAAWRYRFPMALAACTSGGWVAP